MYSTSNHFIMYTIATCSSDTPKVESMPKSKNSKGGNVCILPLTILLCIQQLHALTILRRQRIRPSLRTAKEVMYVFY